MSGAAKTASVIFVVASMHSDLGPTVFVLSKLLGLPNVFHGWTGDAKTLPMWETLIVTDKTAYVGSGLRVVTEKEATSLILSDINRMLATLIKGM